jgi:hypothetical protein
MILISFFGVSIDSSSPGFELCHKAYGRNAPANPFCQGGVFTCIGLLESRKLLSPRALNRSQQKSKILKAVSKPLQLSTGQVIESEVRKYPVLSV